MKTLIKRDIIKIPKDIIVLYCNKTQIIVFKSAYGKSFLKLKTKILLVKEKKLLQVTKLPFFKISNDQKKNLKALQKTYISLIKQKILEISIILSNKLKFIGVGYRGELLEIFKKKLLELKLGYTHKIYFKIPEQLKIISLKSTNFFVFGNSYNLVNQTAAVIRSYKLPEIYKGKGILYENEKLLLKEGKKT